MARGSFRVRTSSNFEKVTDIAAEVRLAALRRAAQKIRDDAAGSMVVVPGPSPPGLPPHVHGDAVLLESLGFIVDNRGAVIGPRDQFAGELGHLHEFGGQFGGAVYPPRPFMRPALERNTDFFADQWSGAIGE